LLGSPGPTLLGVDYAIFLGRFGQNVRRARWRLGLTQQEVAARGLSFRWYVEIERGLRNPSVRMVFDLAQILGVSPADLLDVPGARPKVKLSDVKAAAPRRGRKPTAKKR
jgi:transcriptional regulator with XRE-family HTH domain